MTTNSFSSKAQISVGGNSIGLYRLDALVKAKVGDVETLPYSLRILLENLLRYEDGKTVHPADVHAVAGWDPQKRVEHEVQLRPARVLMQDFTGVPAVCDLAAMRDAFVALGKPGNSINPLRAVDLVIDHSVQVDEYGTNASFKHNVAQEYARNHERYLFLRWGQQAFANTKVVPPGTGICHQVNLEYLARVVWKQDGVAYPDSLVGTDSHTTMINGLGVFGWGVGGIEAEAAMLGQPLSLLIPEVVGFKLHGALPEGATATDLVLTVTHMLRKKGVVGKFVEFYGTGLSSLSLPGCATIANMAPEYGATMGFFPVDKETLAYLRFTARDEDQVKLVEAYTKEQGLFRTEHTPDPIFSDTLDLDLGSVVPTMAGPKRPQDSVPLTLAKASFEKTLTEKPKQVTIQNNGHSYDLADGSVVIAAITSCTNTSNPSLMLGAGLLAKKAFERGLDTKPWVKTSFAPGSKVVTDYIEKAGLWPYLNSLRFNLVGYGCTTCIGNSGPLPEAIGKAIKDNNLVAVSVLSGNRNFEGRINPLCRANYLASPPLVVAYAIAGRMDFDIVNEPLGKDKTGQPVFLRDIWPAPEEVEKTMRESVSSDMFRNQYADVFTGDEHWRALPIPEGDLYAWDTKSTYINHPPFFQDMPRNPIALKDLTGLRALAVLGDSVTTDHISPAGSIPADTPAGKYLISRGVQPKDFNSYGARRGNHEVMMRGTFANIRLRNLLAPGTEGGWAIHQPSGEKMSIYDAAMKYRDEGVPLIIVAGKEYGSGSSRDWAAKGTILLGVRAVLAESFERIHRSNLVGMGVLPLEFLPGETLKSLGLSGEEVFDIEGLAQSFEPRKKMKVHARDAQGKVIEFR